MYLKISADMMYLWLSVNLISSSTKSKRKSDRVEESGVLFNGNAPVQLWNDCEDHSSYTLTNEKNSSIWSPKHGSF